MTNLTQNNSEIEYQQFVIELIELVKQHRTQAVQAVQTYTNQLYWKIGELIIARQKEYGWGKSIVKQLSIDLNHNLGNGISWSPRNLWFMRQLVEEYSKVNQIDSELKNIKVKRAVSLLENVKELVFNVPSDNKPSIGILLVPYKDHLEVEYALRSASKPIGVAEYTLSKKLPNELKGKLPSVDDFKNMIL